MSELLRVASSLRKMPDDHLRSLIISRSVNATALRDFFDLAEAICSSKSIAAAVGTLPKTSAKAISRLAAGEPAEAAGHEQLIKLGLADSVGIFESVADVFSQFREPKNLKLVDLGNIETNVESVADECGISAFGTMQALTELVFDLEQRYVREVGKGNVGLPDIKRLANHLRRSNEYAREIFNMARHCSLMTLSGGRWQLGSEAPRWLASSPDEQISLLWRRWLDSIGSAAVPELVEVLDSIDRDGIRSESIRSLFEAVYPLADSAAESRIALLESTTSMIGLSGIGLAAPWLKLVLKGDFKSALEQISKRLPRSGSRLICQADLSLISTGPLPIAQEIQLRRFAEIEVIGMASTYRMTPLSVTHGLETGLSEQQIRGLLEELSSATLPQPIDYLIREAVTRFGRLAVRTDKLSGGARVTSIDPILLTELLNNADLKAFALVREADGSLSSRFESEVLYFGLREAGYAAIRLDAKGNVLSPLKALAAAEQEALGDSILEDIARIRAEESKVGPDLGDDDIQRKIQLAIKNKARAEVTVTTSTGDEITFLLDPVGIANGRLRAKDKKADIERTLPIASIIRVAIT
ncbi:MAG: hypothetical protein RL167_224 [Actinomycetota bacterium]